MRSRRWFVTFSYGTVAHGVQKPIAAFCMHALPSPTVRSTAENHLHLAMEQLVRDAYELAYSCTCRDSTV